MGWKRLRMPVQQYLAWADEQEQAGHFGSTLFVNPLCSSVSTVFVFSQAQQ
jgi:hypothetical protein